MTSSADSSRPPLLSTPHLTTPLPQLRSSDVPAANSTPLTLRFIDQTPRQTSSFITKRHLTSTDTPPPSPSSTSSRPSKRRKENVPPTSCAATPTPKPSITSRKAYTPRRSSGEKLQIIFDALQTVDWSLGEFLFHAFNFENDDKSSISRTTTHSMYTSHFLKGNCRRGAKLFNVGTILNLWLRSPDGYSLADQSEMYSTSLIYAEIKNSRAALTSFATQIIEKKLLSEIKLAVKPSSGLHATLKKTGSQKVEWVDISSDTVSRVREIIKKCQPLLWHYTNMIAGKDIRNQSDQGEAHAERLRRPTDIVATHVISTLNFTRNNEARLLPLSRAFLFFSLSAPVDLISYGSRVGEMVAYTTIHRSLSDLAAHEALTIQEHARDNTKFGFLQFDNVQNYSRQRDHRIGRVNKMNIGIAATYCELDDVDPSWADLDDKRRRVAENKRADLTVDQLVQMLDQKHLDLVFTLHWLRVLVHSIPELSKWKEHISMMFREQAKKIPLPAKPTKVHPLASSGKNEAVTTDLKEGLVDFLNQLGQQEGDYMRRIFVAGGDGLTFQKMLEIQRYLQFHSDPFQSLEILEPVLSLWHAEWTDLSRIFEVHWETSLSRDCKL